MLSIVVVVVVLVGSRVLGMPNALDLSHESAMGISVILDNALGAIGLVQRVRSLDMVTVAVLPGLLVIAGVRVLHSVLELVRNGSVVLLVVIAVMATIVMAHLQVHVSVALRMSWVGGNGRNGDGGQKADLKRRQTRMRVNPCGGAVRSFAHVLERPSLWRTIDD